MLMKNLLRFGMALFFMSAVHITVSASGDITFNVQGIQPDDTIFAYISSESFLKRQILTSDGDVVFYDVPTGTHTIKLEARGYNIPQSKIIIIEDEGTVTPSEKINLAVTKMSENPDEWSHHWESDGSISGYVTTAHVNTAPVIEFLGKKIVPSDVSFSDLLFYKYNIILSDVISPWSEEYAYRLCETFKTIPIEWAWDKIREFRLTSEHLADDIIVEDTLSNSQIITISEDAFYYANPFLVNLDGVRGRFFSKRLHHAIVKVVTDFGRNKDMANAILENRFGCSINVPSYEELTRGITDEDASCFQDFLPSELVAIINMLEELPEGYHVTPHLNYLIRRKNGHLHPISPQAAAVSWCIDNGYIEFMESTFGDNNESFGTQRLILHEKTHFLWKFSFSSNIKEEWIRIGGWYEDPNNGNQWSTTKETEFVSAYAHEINPDEDMAESVSCYLKDPDLLMSRAPEKYEFIRDRIMHGTRYISRIRDDLTFEVLNLFPDYDYPGKIKRLDIIVEGGPEEDKEVTVEIELTHIEGLEDGASVAITRVSSPRSKDYTDYSEGQYYDMWLNPVDDNPHLLRGTTTFSKYSCSGYWISNGIQIYDEHGNARLTNTNDYAWNLYINNPLEDLIQPTYVSGSLAYELTDTILENGYHALNWKVTCKANENVGMDNVVIRIGCEEYYSYDDIFGYYDEETQICTFNCIIPDFYKEADYYVGSLRLCDLARNMTNYNFSDSPTQEQRIIQTIHTPNPDYDAPELDLNRIVVYAEPTNKLAPDGETLVTINFYARDNISGLGLVSFSILDPQGFYHGDWFYHRNVYGQYFDGDPTVWEKYTIQTILPRGSAPGIWGLASLMLQDKALNGKTYNFVETCIFEPDESETDYVLFTELEDNDSTLNISLTSTVYDVTKYQYRIIHDDTGLEITDTVVVSSLAPSRAPRRSGSNGESIDISALPDGKIVVIVIAMDSNDKPLSVKSTQVEKHTIKYYIVRFCNSDSTVLQMDTLLSGTMPEYIGENPTKESTEQYAYTFREWSENIAPITGDVTFIAIFDPHMFGDVSDNASVDVQDATIVVNYILGERSDNYMYYMADMNNDTKIDVFDLTAIINVILGRTSFQAPIRTGSSGYESTAYLSSNRSTNIVGEEDIYLRAVYDKICLSIANASRFTSFQLDIEVPDGAELQNVELTGSESTHFVQKAKIGDNLYRVIALSMSSQPLADVNDEFVSFQITNAANAEISVSNVMFVTPKGEAHYFNGASIKTPTIINEITTDNDEVIFDLSGRRINKKPIDLERGVYIINKNKVVIK